MNFFQELEELRLKTPRIGSIRLQNINSEYTHNTDQCKNCYLIANAVGNQDCMYGRDFYKNSDCVDCDHIFKNTLCYECIKCKECWNCSYLQDCNNCQDCDCGYDLKDCKNCIGCAGLRKKEFHIFNKPYSKEDFMKMKALFAPEEIQKKFEEVKLKTPRVYFQQINAENCFGDNLYHCKNAWYAFDCDDCHDAGYTSEGKELKDCWDIFVLEYAELCYECSSNYRINNCNFCFSCTNSSDLDFCELVFNSKYCFGCIGLNHKGYHILNRPYSREDYFKRVAEIKEQLRRGSDYGKGFWSPTYPFQDTVGSWPRL